MVAGRLGRLVCPNFHSRDFDPQQAPLAPECEGAVRGPLAPHLMPLQGIRWVGGAGEGRGRATVEERRASDMLKRGDGARVLLASTRDL